MFQKFCCEGKECDERINDLDALEFHRWLKGPRTAKTKMKPLTQKTITRFELLSGLLIARLMKLVREIFESIVQVKEVLYLGDSKVELH